jgi:hypothetical protein
MLLRIPQDEREHMAAFVSAEPGLLDALLQATVDCPPALFQEDVAFALESKLEGAYGASRRTIDSVVRTLFAVYSVLRIRANLGPSDAAAEAIEAIQSDGKLGTPADGWSAFQSRLVRFLSDDNVLALSARAFSVSTESKGHMHAARVLTDARPVFGENPKEGPKAFVILHTLQIEHSEDGKNREWFISLDGDDLETLRGVADRALEKEVSLRVAVEKLGVPVLSWKIGE